MKVCYDCRPAPQHVKSWHLGQIGRGAARVAGTPMTVAMVRLTTPTKSQHQPKALWAGVDGRARSAIASFGLFKAITVAGKGLTTTGRW